MDTINTTEGSFLNLSVNSTMPYVFPVKDRDAQWLANLRHVCYDRIMPLIFCFGIFGNLVNIIILSKRRIHFGIDKLEKCALIGFVCLAVSDMVYCVIGLPAALLQQRLRAKADVPLEVVEILYTQYKTGLLNIFMFTSTWGVVAIATQRYLVVMHPLKARTTIRIRHTLIAPIVITIAGILINIPQFLQLSTLRVTLPNGEDWIFIIPGPMDQYDLFRNIYVVTYHSLSALLPMAMMCFCNSQLVYAIHRSRSRGLLSDNKYSTSRITLILVGIIVFYIALVGPSVIIDLLLTFASDTMDEYTTFQLKTATVICNLLQSINYAINFILYLAFHPKFRAQIGFRCNSSVRRMSSKKSQNRVVVDDKRLMKCTEV